MFLFRPEFDLIKDWYFETKVLLIFQVFNVITKKLLKIT